MSTPRKSVEVIYFDDIKGIKVQIFIPADLVRRTDQGPLVARMKTAVSTCMGGAAARISFLKQAPSPIQPKEPLNERK